MLPKFPAWFYYSGFECYSRKEVEKWRRIMAEKLQKRYADEADHGSIKVARFIEELLVCLRGEPQK